jgi:uncharacterized protein YgiM (DUF1202 family)
VATSLRTFNRLLIFAVVAVMVAGFLATARPAAAQVTLTGTVTNAYYLNTRTGPGVSYPIHQRLSYGQQVILIGRNAAATWVQIQSGSVEWVNAYYILTYGSVASLPISTATGTPGGSTQSIPAVVGIVDFLNTRTGPGANYPVHQQLARGQQIFLIGRNAAGSWVQLQSGSVEWVNASYLYISGSVASLPVSTTTGSPASGILSATIGGVYFLNVRSGPGVAYAVVRRLAVGDPVWLIGRNADTSWVQLQSSTGGQEWINARYAYASGALSVLPVTSSSTTTPSTPSTYRTHVVQAGENLYRIALSYGVSLPVLAAWNGIVDYSRIYVGQVLIIP